MVDDHEDYLPGEAPAAHKVSHQDGGTDEISVAGLAGETAALAAHKVLPTIHQNAPGLIETHRLVPGAHHAKYTDAEARALFSPISFPPVSFTPRYDTDDFFCQETFIQNRATITVQVFYAPVYFPHGVTVTKVTLYGFRWSIDPELTIHLKRVNRAAGSVLMSTISAAWTDGAGSAYDNSISYATIDNVSYSYVLQLVLNPVRDVSIVSFYSAMIDFTG